MAILTTFARPMTNRGCRYALLIVINCSLFACRMMYGQAPTAADSSREELHGIVVNSVTNKPIARALVFSGDQRYAMLTDQEGRFEFKFPEPTPSANDGNSSGISYSGYTAQTLAWNLSARKPGYLESYRSFHRFQSASASSEIIIPLTPEGIVAGKVALSITDPPAGVTVQLLHKEIQEGRAEWRTAGVARTNSKGEFRIAELAAGDYKLMTKEWVIRDPVADASRQQHYGYPPVYYPNAENFASSGILHVAPGETVQADFSLTRQAYYPVRIELANANRGMGLGVRVIAGVEAEQGPAGFDLGYNYRDQRVEGELPNGTYIVETTGYLPGAGGSSGTVMVTVNGGPAMGPRLTLVPNQSISVLIKDERSVGNDGTSDANGGVISFGGDHAEKQRIANVYLVAELGGYSSGGLRPPNGPDDDSPVIENVASGKYWVRVDASNGYAASITSGVTDLLREPLVVGGAGMAAPIEVRVRNDYASLEATVPDDAMKDTNASGAPIPESAYLYFVPAADDGARYQEMMAQIGMKIMVPNLVPGTYRVIAFDRPQQLEYRNAEAMRAYERLGTVVTVMGGQTRQVELTKITPGKT